MLPPLSLYMILLKKIIKQNEMEKLRVYTPSQVGQHSSKNDIWLTINGRVLDVTKFLEEHPGGEEVLMEYGGKDASTGFEAVGHTKEAYNLLLKFQVGCLQGYNNVSSDKHLAEGNGRVMEAHVLKDDRCPEYSILVEFVAPLFVASIYFCYRCFTGALNFGS